MFFYTEFLVIIIKFLKKHALSYHLLLYLHQSPYFLNKLKSLDFTSHLIFIMMPIKYAKKLLPGALLASTFISVVLPAPKNKIPFKCHFLTLIFYAELTDYRKLPSQLKTKQSMS